jgi:hypothetical protein
MSVLLLGALLAAASPGAATPDAFVWQWNVETGANHDGVYRLTLDESVYRQVTRSDLRDLAAFDVKGLEVPFGPVPWRELPAPDVAHVVAGSDTRASSEKASFVYAVNWFPVPRDQPGVNGDALELHIERDADGRLRRLDATAPDVAATAQTRGDILIDLGKPSRDVTALDVRLKLDATQSFSATVDVLRSDDLRHFQLLDARQTLLVLHQDGRSLERLRLQLPSTRGPYLLLRRTDEDTALPVSRIDAHVQPPPVDTRTLQLRTIVADAEGAGAHSGEFLFKSGGPFPIERLSLTLAGGNAVADVVIESRDAQGDAPWRRQAGFTAFRVSSGGQQTGSLPIDIGISRDRYWRVLTSPPQASAPTLELGYRADQFVLMTQGEPPHRIVAGSARETRANFPLQSMLDTLRARWGHDWDPPMATLSGGTTAAGVAALEPKPKALPIRQWILWGVLIAGSAIVIFMVMRLLRASEAVPPE